MRGFMMRKLEHGRKILATKKASLIGRAVAMAPTGQFRSIDPVAYDYAKLGSKKASIVLGKKFYATLTRKTAAGGANLKKILALLGASGIGAGTAYGASYDGDLLLDLEMAMPDLGGDPFEDTPELDDNTVTEDPLFEDDDLGDPYQESQEEQNRIDEREDDLDRKLRDLKEKADNMFL